MLNIENFKTENAAFAVTDTAHPRFSFALTSDRAGAELKSAVFRLGSWRKLSAEQAVEYDGPALKPRTRYTVSVSAEDSFGEFADAEAVFETGKLDEPWAGRWISHPGYRFTEKHVSPRPMRFQKTFSTAKTVAAARLYVTALGLYVCELNGRPSARTISPPALPPTATRCSTRSTT